jgi:glutamyl-tRNA synthetase
LTGKTTSPPIFDVLGVLGKDESVARLRDRTPPAVPGQTARSAPI